MTRIEALRRLRAELAAQGIADAEAEARHALASLLDCELSELFTRGTDPLPAACEDAMPALVRRRAAGEPLAYILGERWFMGRRFAVTPDVLIPRQETELLAERAIELAQACESTRALDLCTGSGCVAIALAAGAPNAQVDALDVSGAALCVARANAAAQGVRVRFFVSDLFAAVDGRYDVITANPPYVTEAEYAGLAREVLCEPQLALVAGQDGLGFYRRIAREAGAFLVPGGTLLMEIGSRQGAAVQALLERAGFADVRVRQDYALLDRLIEAKFLG